MIGNRAAIGLSLLCALAFCAFAAQSASASGTTAFTCVEGGGEKDFKDAHCDEKVTAGTGSFGHVAIAPGVVTSVVGTNEKTKNKTTESTPAVMKGEVALSKIEITCTTWSSTGTLENKEVEGVMQGVAEGTTTYSGCTVQKPSTKCTVTDPETKKAGTIVVRATAITRTNLGAGKNEMGGEVKPVAGKPFVELLFQGAECVLNTGKAFPVEGSAIATGTPINTASQTGATAIFTEAMTKETLVFGGKPASLSSTSTVRMVGEGGNPIVGTTTAN
jgi:hypothetical protein